MRTTKAVLFLTAALAAEICRASSWEYTFSIPDGMPGTFEMPFEVQYAGDVTIDANWDGARLLFFGVDGPAGTSIAHRSGPSPQRLAVPAEASVLGQGVGWKLTIKALPARGSVSGRIRVTVPDAPAVVAAREAAAHPPPVAPPPPPAWMLAKNPPAGASAEVSRVFAAVEAFRASATAKDGAPDACGWQLDFLRFAAEARERLASVGAPPDLPTLRYFARLVDAVRTVEGLRTSADPIVAGPIAGDREDRRAWLIARYELIRPVERKLDVLTELLRGGHAPALEEATWLPRFTACLTACERYFDEKVRLSGTADVPSGELADAQWGRILAAGEVFDAFSPFRHEPQEQPDAP
jgi:hypothetical protein